MQPLGEVRYESQTAERSRRASPWGLVPLGQKQSGGKKLPAAGLQSSWGNSAGAGRGPSNGDSVYTQGRGSSRRRSVT